MRYGMRTNDLVLVQGLRDTGDTLSAWNARPWPVLRDWLAASLLVAVGLLVAVWAIASISTPDATPIILPGLQTRPSIMEAIHVLGRNSLVLALHAMACVAGFIAGSSLVLSAERRSGLSRWVHEKAGPLAIGFVVCATTFSLCTQAYALGHSAADVSFHMGTSPGRVLVALMPHAVPELTALFLPLAAWVVASRRGDWHQLLAATVVTTAIAAPVLFIASLVEVYVSPHVAQALAG